MNSKPGSSVGGCAKAIAALLCVLLVLAIVGGQLALTARLFLLRPAIFKQALVEGGVYAQLPDLVAGQIVSRLVGVLSGSGAGPSGGMAGLQPLAQAIPAGTWSRVVASLVPQDWARVQAEGLIDALFAYLEGGQEHLALRVSLVELKANFQSGGAETAVDELMNALPPCSGEELLRFGLAALSSAAPPQIPACRPPEALMGLVRPLAVETLKGVFAQAVPDEVNLDTGAGSIAAPLGPALARLQTLMGDLRLAALLLPALALVLLLLVALVAVRSVRGLLSWWGFPLLGAGLLGGGLALILWLGFNPAAARFLLTVPAASAPGLFGLGVAVAGFVARAFARWLALESAAIGVAGLAMVLAYGVLRRRAEAAGAMT